METLDDFGIDAQIKPYIDEISERLWSGHAAIMVGSGFSKNAQPLASGRNTFPDWNELGNQFYKKLYGDLPKENQHYLNALKLADEVNAAYGRPVLDQILHNSIDDTGHRPTEIYTKLLRLNWSDVFTTNYDTLLERAREAINERNYQVVLRKEDLVNSKSPRIIKLHGSFPSHTPFIITEEDYRTYPIKYAPFVNTVQQSLIEKTLCLIGFSGDDPNFLKWVGWIKDNFPEENSLKIYWIGICGFSDSQRKLLERRNISIIDFDCMRNQGIDGADKALNLFFEYLYAQKGRENALGWPFSEPKSGPDLNAKNKAKEIENIIPIWQESRKSYPGWRILPKDRRNILLTPTEGWISYIDDIEDLSDECWLEFYYELTWRLEKSLYPVWDNLAKKIQSSLDLFWPFENIKENNEHRYTAGDNIPNENTSWSDIKVWYISLSLILLRYYREEARHSDWIECDRIIQKIKLSLSAEQFSQWHYEKSLYYIFLLDFDGALEQVNAWPENVDLPFWESKRAGLLAELMQIDQAKNILEKSLNKVRKRQNLKLVTNDYSDVSEESYIMYLLHNVKFSSDWLKGEYSFEGDRSFNDRWNILQQYKCDPWSELQELSVKLEGVSQNNPAKQTKYKFDLGESSTSFKLGNRDSDAVVAFSFLKLCEDVGLPFRLPRINIQVQSAVGCLSRIQRYTPHWALITLVRVNDAKAVDNLYNREAIYNLSSSEIDSLIKLYIQVLDKNFDDTDKDSQEIANEYRESLGAILPEILSRLCLKSSIQNKEKIVDILIDIFGSKKIKNYKNIKNLTKRLIRPLKKSEQYSLLPKLLKIRIPDNYDEFTSSDISNPFLFLTIDDNAVDVFPQISIDNSDLKYYFSKLTDSNSLIRNWSIFTLVKLNDYGLLCEDDKKKLEKEIWRECNASSLPDIDVFYQFVWLKYQKYHNYDAENKFRDYILNYELPIQKEKGEKGIPMSGGWENSKLRGELSGAKDYIEIPERILKNILKKVINQWDQDKFYLSYSSSPMSGVKEEFETRFYYLVLLLAESLIPALIKEKDEELKISQLLSDMREHGIPCLYPRAVSVSLKGAPDNSLSNEIKSALNSRDIYRVVDALEAIYALCVNSLSFDKMAHELLEFSAHSIIWSVNKCTVRLLSILTQLIYKFPIYLTSSIESVLHLGLKNLFEVTGLEENDSSISLEQRLNVRKYSMQLAFALFGYYQQNGRSVPDIVSSWRQLSDDPSEFDDIKVAWGRFL